MHDEDDPLWANAHGELDRGAVEIVDPGIEARVTDVGNRDPDHRHSPWPSRHRAVCTAQVHRRTAFAEPRAPGPISTRAATCVRGGTPPRRGRHSWAAGRIDRQDAQAASGSLLGPARRVRCPRRRGDPPREGRAPGDRCGLRTGRSESYSGKGVEGGAQRLPVRLGAEERPGQASDQRVTATRRNTRSSTSRRSLRQADPRRRSGRGPAAPCDRRTGRFAHVVGDDEARESAVHQQADQLEELHLVPEGATPSARRPPELRAPGPAPGPPAAGPIPRRSDYPPTGRPDPPRIGRGRRPRPRDPTRARPAGRGGRTGRA